MNFKDLDNIPYKENATPISDESVQYDAAEFNTMLKTMRELVETTDVNNQSILRNADDITALRNLVEDSIDFADERIARGLPFKFRGQPCFFYGMPSSHYRLVYASDIEKYILYICFSHEQKGQLFVQCNPTEDGLYYYNNMFYGNDWIESFFGENLASKDYDGKMSKEDKVKLDLLTGDENTVGSVANLLKRIKALESK